MEALLLVKDESEPAVHRIAVQQETCYLAVALSRRQVQCSAAVSIHSLDVGMVLEESGNKARLWYAEHCMECGGGSAIE